MRKALPLLLGLLACKGGGDTDSDTPEGMDVTLSFEAVLGMSPAACGTPVTIGGVEAELADGRMFLSDIELRNADGDWVPLMLTPDDKWQREDLVLLDFEDGTGACADSGNSDLNDQAVGTVADGDYDAVRFVLGVPFEDNHNDSATEAPPLNAPGMFWTWQGGYKFVRVDYMTTGATPTRWNVHIGSTACESAAPVEAPANECGRSNRSTITLEGIDPMADTIEVDLGALVDGADISVNTVDTPPGCMSMPMEPDDCNPVYSNVGLDFATGSCTTDCSDQAVFSAN